MKEVLEKLGLEENATFIDVKEAYHKLSKKYHPDVNGNTDENIRQFRRITDAYNEIKSEINNIYNYFEVSNKNNIDEIKAGYFKKIEHIKSVNKDFPEKLNAELKRANIYFRFIESSKKQVNSEGW